MEHASRVRWNGTAASMLLVRYAQSGEVLPFARGGASVASAQGDLELVTSDGV